MSNNFLGSDPHAGMKHSPAPEESEPLSHSYFNFECRHFVPDNKVEKEMDNDLSDTWEGRALLEFRRILTPHLEL